MSTGIVKPNAKTVGGFAGLKARHLPFYLVVIALAIVYISPFLPHSRPNLMPPLTR